ncbi:vancomycin resistance protein YoaR [Kineosphaera limosa]|uniref:YoaR-like putative peptidoglycan binding domain-containing protein n=1 Tax=Kineosphaera limosa NBRC 100340 TaxID=1184609 RepID=K6VIG3_9MICO|nr:peptidoglycan binding domain-containing protein [Kineosphaera limosa]NYE02452.1 vancomycin resistance protein YoaR [Kineosphaera limosa]GAB96023.1 hypothetical protein KILIM_030_00660 [Kineosphaera limosa NBRC 100340]
MERVRTIAAILAPAILLGALYLGVAWLVGRQLPSQASVAGVHIGGMTPQAATDRLAGKLSNLGEQEIVIDLPGRTVRTKAVTLGLAPDLPATLAQETGLSFDPRQVWHRLTGGGPIPLRSSLDAGRAVAALADDVAAVDQPVVQPQITLTSGTVEVVRPGPGRHVDVAATLAAVQADWPQTRHVQAVVQTEEPQVSPESFDEAVEQVAKPAVAGPLNVVLGRRDNPLTVAQFAPTLRMVAADATMQLRVDTPTLAAVLREHVPALEVAPVDADVRLASGRPQVVPDQPGRSLDEGATAERVRSALSARDGDPPSRRAGIVTDEQAAAITTADATQWGVQHELASVELPAAVADLPDPGAQIANVTTGADTIAGPAGRLLRPGESLSLVQLIGDPTGRYPDAPEPTVAGPAWRPGGGLSQLASALYAAGWQAGVDLGPRRAHDIYLPDYPLGLDATYSWPDADVTLTNPGPGALLVGARVSGQQVQVELWGRRDTAVQEQIGPRRDVLEPTPQGSSDPWSCVEQPLAAPGFAVQVRRDVVRGRTAAPAHVEEIRYEPLHPIRCDGAPPTP